MKESWYIRNGLKIKEYRDGQHECKLHVMYSHLRLHRLPSLWLRTNLLKNISVFNFKFEYGVKISFFYVITLINLIEKIVLKYWRHFYVHFFKKKYDFLKKYILIYFLNNYYYWLVTVISFLVHGYFYWWLSKRKPLQYSSPLFFKYYLLQ